MRLAPGQLPATVLLASMAAAYAAAPQPSVFPKPRQIEMRSDALRLEASVPVLLPAAPSPEDRFLARFLIAELAEKKGLALQIRQVSALPKNGRFVLMGSMRNPLVAEYCRGHNLSVSEREGYALSVDAGAAVVAGADDSGAFYGLQSMRQLLRRTAGGWAIQGVRILDWPHKPFRGIKLYLPGRENIGYFKRFIRDFMALYKFNTVIVEMNASMRFDRHPELNAGFIEFGKDMNYTRRERSWGPGRQVQDSANADTGDFGVLEKEEVAGLVRFARQHHVEFMPEIPSLTHSYYLLTRHRELAEVPDAEWPDTYCPSEPKVYDLLFDVMDEYIEVMQPRMVHAGHDEWRMPLGVCRRCKGKDPTELYISDVNKIYAHLKQKGVALALWGDHLIEPLRGKKVRNVPNPRGTPYVTPGALSPEQVKQSIPKDILLFNWFWDSRKGEGLENGLGEPNEVALDGWGFQQVFGNFAPHFANWDRRSARTSVLGGAPSSWAATNELNFGKDQMYDFLGCGNLLWSMDRPDAGALSLIVQRLLPGIRRNLSALPLPSDDNPVTPVSVAAAVNSEALKLKGGPVRAGNLVFEVPQGRVVAATGDERLAISEDVSSLVFLHASTRPGRNAAAYTGVWNFADTAELVGWYEAVYDDGFTTSIPLRYGVNILESAWASGKRSAKAVAYEAELVDAGDGVSLFAYEWINPRFGKPIREVRLHSKSRENSVLLAGLAMVKKRTPPEPKPLRLVE